MMVEGRRRIADDGVCMLGRYVFNVLIEDNIVYMCLSDEKGKRRIPFLFLEDLKKKFRADYADRVHTAHAFAMNTEFQGYMQRQMDYYNDSKESDALSRVSDRLEEVKGVMVENIDKVLQRGEKIELLVDKSAGLAESANRFRHSVRAAGRLNNADVSRSLTVLLLVMVMVSLVLLQAKTLETHMWWKNIKIWAMIIVLLFVIIYIIIGSICGFDFSKCGNNSSAPKPKTL